MGGRIIVVLAIVIIIISGTGIFLTKNEQKRQVEQQEAVKQPATVEAEVLVLLRDVNKGEAILDSDVKPEKRKIAIDNLKNSLIVDKPVSYVVGALSNFDMKTGAVLKYDDITRHVLTEDDVALEVSNKNDLVFRFSLNAREFDLVKNIKKGDLVDVYFRYELKTKSSDTGIVAKGRDDAYQQSKENANLSKFVLMFKDKRVLNIIENKSIPTQKNSISADKGVVVLQMSPDDIKSVYSIENLGKFYLFPAQEDSVSSVSTKKILSKDFIKEIRGGVK